MDKPFLTSCPFARPIVDLKDKFVNAHPRAKSILASILGVTLAFQPIIAQAAIHPMSTIRTESTTLQTVDLAVNVDFDYDATPVATSNGLTLDRADRKSVV